MLSRLPIYYSDIYETKPEESELNELLAQFDGLSTFRLLAMINTLLSFFDRTEERARYVQGFLFQNLTTEDLFERVKKKFPTSAMTQRPIFHRQQLLALMKRVLLKEQEGELNPNDDLVARHKLGEACLLQNELLDNEDHNKRLEHAAVVGEEDILTELFAQLLFTVELSNPADVLYAIVRSDEFCKILERRSCEFKFSNGESILDRFTRLTGLKLHRYIWMFFCLCIVYLNESESLEELINDPAKFNVSKATVFSNTSLSEEEVNAFFHQIATNPATIIEMLRNTNTKVSLVSDYDFTAFRTYPLYYVNEQQDIASPIDFTFLTEKLSAGVFHTISNSIRTEDNKDWHSFSGFWGMVFDEYVNDRLRTLFPLIAQRFYSNPFLDRANQEAFDSVIDYGDSLVVMEYKGTYLTLDAKYSGQADALLAGIGKNLGKGVKQIAAKLEAIFNSAEHDTFSQRDNSNEHKLYTFGSQDLNRVRKIYPVMVVQEFALQSGLANYKIRQEFKREIEGRLLRQGVTVMPLSLLTVEDIEKVIPYLEDFTLPTILDEYISPKQEPLYSFQNVLNRFLNEKSILQHNNEWVLSRGQELTQLIKEHFNMRS